MIRRCLAGIALLLLFALAARAAEPCCVITAIDARTGVVTARVKSTGRTLQFEVKNAATLRSLKVGQSIYANLSAKQVSLDGRAVCCVIVRPPVIQPPCNGTVPVTLHVTPETPGTFLVSAQATAPPRATMYSFVAVVPLDGDTYDLGGGTDPGVIWTPQEAGDYKLTVTVTVLVPAGPPGPVPIVPCGTASVNYHVSPQITSTVALSATPFSQKTSDSMHIPYSLAGNISLSAIVSWPAGTPIPGPSVWVSVLRNKYLFSYGPGFGNPATAPPGEQGQGTLETPFPKAIWTPSPQPAPDFYRFGVDVQTFVNRHLVAEGTGGLYGYVVLIPPGPCASWTTPANPTLPFGWLSPITTQNTTQPVGTAQSGADCAVASSAAGYTLNDIVNNPQIRVRKINVACVNCHMDMGFQQKSTFCTVFPQTVNWIHATDEPVLNNLLQDWKSRGCPD